ncbi:DUF5994 family protein [Crossiella cryophila]|uniref:Uncharacterized protein n=1 Tax=Crossiella cryophila TaxID=43355 RepID=A0A7W7FTP9_9PSEU|nr:DUF5994 family protein [Crossiella cryophila]MBB4678411.1 hypothetical protein [Crossiella cryophila]
MMSSPHAPFAAPLAPASIEPPGNIPRLRLKPQARVTGYVDGAWWPRTRDLAAELTALLPVLTIRLGRVERVTFNLTMWQPTARRLPVHTRSVRVEGFRAQQPDTVTVTGRGRQRLVLLVVPPETRPAIAHDIMMSAARRGNADSVSALLTVNLGASAGVSLLEQLDPDTQRWELDGGRFR